MNARQKLIQHGILKTSSNSAPYMLEETVIFTTVNFTVRPKASLSEFDLVCVIMEERALIKRIRTEDGGLKIKITDEGLAALNE